MIITNTFNSVCNKEHFINSSNVTNICQKFMKILYQGYLFSKIQYTFKDTASLTNAHKQPLSSGRSSTYLKTPILDGMNWPLKTLSFYSQRELYN